MIEESKKQNNMESIASKAIPLIGDDAKPENVDDDWITNFFDKCRLISNEEMQILWAKILAGEANSPGKFSKRTVNFLATLDKPDAELFTRLCSYSVNVGGLTPLIYDVNDSIYKDGGIHFTTLTHLDSIGMVKYEPLAGFIRKGLSKSGYITYFDTPLWIEFANDSDNDMQLGNVLFSRIGQELAGICSATPRDGFVGYLRSKWQQLGYKTEPSA